MDDDDLLNSLLSVATKELSELQEKCKLKENVYGKSKTKDQGSEKEFRNGKKSIENALSIIHGGDTDSSEDEERRNSEDKRYNDCGKEIKHLLAAKSSSSQDSGTRNYRNSPGWNKKIDQDRSLAVPKKTSPNNKVDVYTDPVFGLRIINPVISSTELQQRMVGRMILPFSRIKNFCQKKEITGDFVIAGVIVNKSAVKTSQKGSQYSLWFLSDLKGDIKTVSLFLFGNAHKQLWKTSTGTVIGVLNPSILDKKDGSKDEGCFSIDNPQMAMILGQSKDLGVCRSKKKNGDPCTAIVDLSRCEFCIYHIQQEYQKCSRRSELQSTFSGKGLTALRNKVLGKDQVFYAGKLYTSIPAKKSRKHEQQDEMRLKSLHGLGTASKNIVKAKSTIKKKAAANLDVPLAQRKKDLEILKRLGVSNGEHSTITSTQKNSMSHSTPAFDIQESKNIALDVISRLKEKKYNQQKENLNTSTSKSNDDSSLSNPKSSLNSLNNSDSDLSGSPKTVTPKFSDRICAAKDIAMRDFPTLSKTANNVIDLNTPLTPKHISRAKLNAIKFIQKNGPIQKEDPNSIGCQKKTKSPVVAKLTEVDIKKQKIQESELFSDRFKKMMEATSKHTDLLEQHDDEEKEKYFHKLEVKEQMEEKMTSTYKVACKAVRCLQCKYTNFSAADSCKAEKHPLKVFDAMKRFFKCGNCNNRTVSLEVVPTRPCSNCGSDRWERTGMMKEKIVQAKEGLSIRGGEQKYVNSVVADANINLLVPDEEA